MMRKYEYKGTDGNGGTFTGVTKEEFPTINDAIDHVNKIVHSIIYIAVEGYPIEENEEKISTLLDEGREQYEYFCNVSEELFGYREGKQREIIKEVRHLVELKKQFNTQENVKELVKQIKVLSEIVTDIESE